MSLKTIFTPMIRVKTIHFDAEVDGSFSSGNIATIQVSPCLPLVLFVESRESDDSGTVIYAYFNGLSTGDGVQLNVGFDFLGDYQSLDYRVLNYDGEDYEGFLSKMINKYGSLKPVTSLVFEPNANTRFHRTLKFIYIPISVGEVSE